MGKVQLVDDSGHASAMGYIAGKFIEVDELLSVRRYGKSSRCTGCAGK